MNKIILAAAVSMALVGCKVESSSIKDTAKAVERQQQQYAASQPVPAYDWSLERHLLIELYDLRNTRAVTHSVWRSDYGMIEGDCPSMGFGIPFDTSLTNPLQIGAARMDYGYAILEQAEPNGIYASKNTNATWVMCVDSMGGITPIYTESKVTAYPMTVSIDYETNRVIMSGKSNVTLNSK